MCKSLHAAAHFQWRHMYHKGTKPLEIQKDFDKRIQKLYFGTHDLSKTKPSDQTFRATRLANNFIKNYDLDDPPNLNYKIINFDQIGWIDPFPNED